MHRMNRWHLTRMSRHHHFEAILFFKIDEEIKNCFSMKIDEFVLDFLVLSVN